MGDFGASFVGAWASDDNALAAVERLSLCDSVVTMKFRSGEGGANAPGLCSLSTGSLTVCQEVPQKKFGRGAGLVTRISDRVGGLAITPYWSRSISGGRSRHVGRPGECAC